MASSSEGQRLGPRLRTPRGGLRTPRASLLGLDALAKKKRDAAALESANGNGSRKKYRYDDVDEPFFKGIVSAIVFWSLIYCNLHSP